MGPDLGRREKRNQGLNFWPVHCRLRITAAVNQKLTATRSPWSGRWVTGNGREAVHCVQSLWTRSSGLTFLFFSSLLSFSFPQSGPIIKRQRIKVLMVRTGGKKKKKKRRKGGAKIERWSSITAPHILWHNSWMMLGHTNTREKRSRPSINIQELSLRGQRMSTMLESKEKELRSLFFCVSTLWFLSFSRPHKSTPVVTVTLCRPGNRKGKGT